MTPTINIPIPELQIDFAVLLEELRSIYLQKALSNTIETLDLTKLDQELSQYVPQKSLKSLAKHGLRGELVFAVPYVLESNPFLIGYYRLLLGFSQKEFYSKDFGVSSFKLMETKGILRDKHKPFLSELCNGMINSAVGLVDGIGVDRLSRVILDDLTLLTIGPQLRGGANVRKGISGTLDVFDCIHDIVQHAITESNANTIQIKNAAGRVVLIEFRSDPDIVIREEMGNQKFRNIIAIEVKGGTDFSNIHNRVGEAEKSHQKAKASGFVECWTVVNVDRIDVPMAKRESPSTNTFYKLSDIKEQKGSEYQDFKNRLVSLTGIKH